VNGNLERARTEYVNALRFKPNNPEALSKLNELNIKLGIVEDSILQKKDTVVAVESPVVP
jgi:hypothetical protein